MCHIPVTSLGVFALLVQAQAAYEEASKKKLPDVPAVPQKASPGNSDTMLADVSTASTHTMPDRMPIDSSMCSTVGSLDCSRNCKKDKFLKPDVVN